MAAGTVDGEVSFWDPQTHAQKKFDPDQSAQISLEILSVAFPEDGSRLTAVDTIGSTLSWRFSDFPEETESVARKTETASVAPATSKEAESIPTASSIQAPVIEIISPTLEGKNKNTAKIWQSTITVEAKVTHNSEIEEVRIGGLTSEAMQRSQNDNDLFTGRIRFPRPGNTTFTITAKPKKGDPTTQVIRVIYRKDEMAPEITITHFDLTNGLVSGRVTDSESGVDVNKVKIGTEKIALKSDGTFTHASQLKEGDNTFTITATDKVGKHRYP